MTNLVTFPGLGLEFHLDPVAFRVFGHPVYWYGIIIACGFLLAVWFCYRQAPKFGVKPDSLMDMLIFAVPLSIIGARAYYVVAALSRNTGEFRTQDGGLDWMEMVRIWDGGLAIYGGVIVAVIVVFAFCRARRVKFGAYVDLGAFGLLIGQAVGRWGNFVNAEAFGYETDLPWRMGVNVWDSNTGAFLGFQEVHPTFLYESLWNLVGLALLLLIARRWRRFDGQIFLSYVVWYGLGRGWIEGLRRDYLPLFHWTVNGEPLRVSQVLALASAAVAAGLLVYHLAVKKHSPEELLVNQVEVEDNDDTGREDAGGEDQGGAGL